MKTNLVILKNTYTTSCVVELCNNSSRYLLALKKNKLSKYKKLGKYNEFWILLKEVPIDAEYSIIKGFRKWVEHNLILVHDLLKVEDLFKLWNYEV